MVDHVFAIAHNMFWNGIQLAATISCPAATLYPSHITSANKYLISS